MIILFIIALIIILIGGILLFTTRRTEKKVGVLTQEKLYQDTDEKPGEVLRAKTLNLVGKPDYIVRTEEGIIPVEVKTGKTPSYPYENHVMQLTAYCLLVEEVYGARPRGGIIRYEKTRTEFKIAYTQEAEQALRNAVVEIINNKENNTEFQCNHPEHNL